MQLSRKQEEAVNIAVQRFRSKERYTVISGYAGAGKSTCVRFIVAALGLPEDKICYATFTGKAAQVLLKKGNKNVSTLHKLLWEHFPREDGSFFRRRVEYIPYELVIVDECSMMPKEIMEELHRHRECSIIYLGDPEQLPPINPEDDNHLLDKPHIFLDEVHRQAMDSEIIRLTMDIRAGRPLELYDGNDVKVIKSDDVVNGMYTWADQIICATNATRVAINNEMRDMLGHTGDPQDGDKVIALSNHWGVLADNEDPLVNGTIGYLKNPYSSYRRIPPYLGGGSFDIVCGQFISDSDANFGELIMDKKQILEGVASLDWKTTYRLRKNPKTQHIVPLDFTYGFCITGHRSQGSEWDKVLVFEERFPFGVDGHRRWLYTVATRAADKLVLVRKD